METIIVAVQNAENSHIHFERILDNQDSAIFDFQSTTLVLLKLFENLNVKITFSVKPKEQIKPIEYV